MLLQNITFFQASVPSRKTGTDMGLHDMIKKKLLVVRHATAPNGELIYVLFSKFERIWFKVTKCIITRCSQIVRFIYT